MCSTLTQLGRCPHSTGIVLSTCKSFLHVWWSSASDPQLWSSVVFGWACRSTSPWRSLSFITVQPLERSLTIDLLLHFAQAADYLPVPWECRKPGSTVVLYDSLIAKVSILGTITGEMLGSFKEHLFSLQIRNAIQLLHFTQVRAISQVAPGTILPNIRVIFWPQLEWKCIFAVKTPTKIIVMWARPWFKP